MFLLVEPENFRSSPFSGHVVSSTLERNEFKENEKTSSRQRSGDRRVPKPVRASSYASRKCNKGERPSNGPPSKVDEVGTRVVDFLDIVLIAQSSQRSPQMYVATRNKDFGVRSRDDCFGELQMQCYCYI